MLEIRSALARTPLRYLLLMLLTAFGALPIVATSIANLRIDRELVEREELLNLSREVEQLSVTLALRLGSVRRQLELVRSGWDTTPDRERGRLLQDVALSSDPGMLVRVVDPGSGLAFQPDLDDQLIAAAEAARMSGAAHVLYTEDGTREPRVIVTWPPPQRSGSTFQAIVPLDVAADAHPDVFLLDRTRGEVLWGARSGAAPVWEAVERSPVVAEFLRHASAGFSVFEYDLRVGAVTRSMLGRIGPVSGTEWAVLVQRPRQGALPVFRRLVDNALVVGAITALLALVCGAIAARFISRPIQSLAETSEEIASGRFGKRVEITPFGYELAELADNFNTMSAHLASRVLRLRRAAQVNRELFVSTLRALLAAIEAKEPYTRGHSERVAAYSREIARELVAAGDGSDAALKDRAWTGGLLHDIGKIGISDRILNKGDVLTAEEFEAMKRHPVIGAEIMETIEPMRQVLPAIRHHHERWSGGGYPDGLEGEEIPLLARIVAVADTFDALTTQRVYQQPYSRDEAFEIIRSGEGKGFDPSVVAAFFRACGSGAIVLEPTVEVAPAGPRPVRPASTVHT